jgi:hypothetical protein
MVLPVLVPALLQPEVRRHLRTATPYLAAALAIILTLPVWIWGWQHGWDNLSFQLIERHQSSGLTLKYLGELAGANLLLVTPFLALAMVIAWCKGWQHHDAAWQVVLIASAMPFVLFALISLSTRVGPHWCGPGLVPAVAAPILIAFRGRRWLIAAGMGLGIGLSLLVATIALRPELLLDVSWSYQGRPHRISTRKVAAAIGNHELAAAVTATRRPSELVASESYSTLHLLAFNSGGRLPVRLAHVKPGKHGLASLYWYRPDQLRGRDVLFVTEKHQVDERLREIFAEVRLEEPILIRRSGRVVRTIRLLRCRNLLHPEGFFTRLQLPG